MALSALFLLLGHPSVPPPPPMADIRIQPDQFAAYPEQVLVNATLTYHRKAGYYAVHYPQPTSAPGAVMQLNDGAIAVYSGTPSAPITGTLGPIYTIPGNGMAVPTGQVLIEFADTETAAQHQQAIQSAGYEIVQSLSYAPNAAWLKASSGQMVDALTGLGKLRAIAKVVTVEPEMLMPPSRR